MQCHLLALMLYQFHLVLMSLISWFITISSYSDGRRIALISLYCFLSVNLMSTRIRIHYHHLSQKPVCIVGLIATWLTVQPTSYKAPSLLFTLFISERVIFTQCLSILKLIIRLQKSRILIFSVKLLLIKIHYKPSVILSNSQGKWPFLQRLNHLTFYLNQRK